MTGFDIVFFFVVLFFYWANNMFMVVLHHLPYWFFFWPLSTQCSFSNNMTKCPFGIADENRSLACKTLYNKSF